MKKIISIFLLLSQASLLFTWWYENGKKEYEGTYSDGRKLSVEEWNEDGSVKE